LFNHKTASHHNPTDVFAQAGDRAVAVPSDFRE